MQRDIADRIDFLMRVTGTSNAQLARALSFDASYISRIRAGKRGLPPELPFIDPAAAFFARNIRERYQVEALAREIGISGAWPTSKAKAARLISRWLDGAGVVAAQQAEGASTRNMPAIEMPHAAQLGRSAETRLFFGDDGRRKAALAFLEKVATAQEPCELLLQSDEDTAWMYEDAGFAQQWSDLMSQLAQAGCTFTVVHTVSRGGNEMWEGVRGWLPLYLTGAIRPYYYPRLRDGVRMRSLFVARNTCALESNSVQGMENEALSILLDDADAASALAHEFDAYLALCLSLAHVDRLESREDLEALIKRYCNAGDVTTADIAGATVCARGNREALIATPGEHPVVYRIEEPRLADAIAGYLAQLS